MPSINFAELKATVPIEDVAAWLGLKLKNNRGECPWCEDDRSFTITPEKKVCGCFKCGQAGKSILDLTMQVRDVPLREAAKLIHDHFLGGSQTRQDAPRQEQPAKPTRTTRRAPEDLGEVQTALERVKARLDYGHEILGMMGFPEVVWRSLGIGYDPRSKRIMYPLYKDGEWVGYGGLATSEDQSPLMLFHRNLVTICAAEPKEKKPDTGRFLRVVK